MKKYNPNIHHRRSIRLKGYDYSQAGLYFITLCVQDRQHLFGKIENNQMKLNIFGKIIAEEWQKTEKIRKNSQLGAFIIMPNHFHGIISIDYQIKNSKEEAIGLFKSPSHTIGAIIRGFKGATTKRIKELIINQKNIRTGELPFAPSGESPFSFTGESFSAGESPFAPTFAPTEAAIQFIKSRIKLKKSIWQRNYWEHIIRNERAYKNITNYIINNPKK